MRDIAHLGAILVVLVISAVHGRPAMAVEVVAFTFVGSANVGPGIGYPCTPVGDLSKCPPLTMGNSATITSVSSSVCVGASATATKNKPLTSGSACSLIGAGTVHGYCGLSTGTMHASVSIGGKHYSLSGTFTGLGGVVAFTGHFENHTTGESFPFFAVALAVPTGGSCLDKGPKTYTLVGAGTGVSPNV